MYIPIIIICYNNYKYVKNTLLQILKINKEYYNNIIILNNASTCIDTINFLKSVDVKVINNENNNGPWINTSVNTHIYKTLPDKFIITDPDLQFNDNLPNNFIDIMSQISDKYRISKLGFALDISDFDKMYQSIYFQGCNIYKWEKQFWNNPINDDLYELYYAPIDTTFCLINKSYINLSNDVRIAGNFLAKHLPWYINNIIYNPYELYNFSINTTKISTINRIIIPYFKDNYINVFKNNELFLIKNNNSDTNLSFWKDTYSNWKNDMFNVLDKFLSKDKIFIDIGGWIGTTTMYGSRKYKYVYSIDADNKSYNDMIINLHTNCDSNYTLINEPIYNIDLIINNYNINPLEIGLIKVNINGQEEHILSDLFKIHNTHNIPIYIIFNYSLWCDKNLDRFDFLSSSNKTTIINDPYCSILLSN